MELFCSFMSGNALVGLVNGIWAGVNAKIFNIQFWSVPLPSTIFENQQINTIFILRILKELFSKWNEEKMGNSTWKQIEYILFASDFDSCLAAASWFTFVPFL